MEIIVVIGIIVLIAGIFLYASKSRAKSLTAREARLARAEKGKAKIIGSSPVDLSGTGKGGRYHAHEFTLEVSNAYKESYKAKSVWEVYPIGESKVHEGMEVNVMIDQDDNNIIYPVADGISFSWNGLMKIMAKKMEK